MLRVKAGAGPGASSGEINQITEALRGLTCSPLSPRPLGEDVTR